MRQRKQIYVSLWTLFFFLVFSAAPAAAGTIEIQFTGLDSEYDSTPAELVDSGSSDPDELTTMTFNYEPTAFTGIFTDETESLTADLVVSGIDALDWPDDPSGSATDGTVELLATYLGHTYELELNLDDITVIFTPISAAVIASATVTTQDLPFGFEIDTNEPISFSFIGNVSSYTTDLDGTVEGFTASGPGVINADGTIPEPSTLALAVFGLIGLSGLVWRRRRAA